MEVEAVIEGMRDFYGESAGTLIIVLRILSGRMRGFSGNRTASVNSYDAAEYPVLRQRDGSCTRGDLADTPFICTFWETASESS